VPDVRDAGARNDIDRFLLAKLAEPTSSRSRRKPTAAR
jgi:hypothetical protein